MAYMALQKTSTEPTIKKFYFFQIF